jgi:DNA-binding transcriptional ArsR family regulator
MTFRVDAERLSRSRFALSALVELTNALEVLVRPNRAPYARSWAERARRRVDAGAIALLLALVDHDSWYVPDFVVPIPDRYEPALADEIEAVAATPAEVVAHQLRLTFRIGEPPPVVMLRSRVGHDPRAPLPAIIDDTLTRHGESGLARRVAGQLDMCWGSILDELWPTVRRVLDEDIRHRATLASRVGFSDILADLHPLVGWDGSRVTIRSRNELEVDARPGLVLAPSVLLPRPAVWLGDPSRVLLGYPARARGEVWSAPEPTPGETAVLGIRRAALLADLNTPRSTTELAARHGLSCATVSYHLGRLREAGLITPRRAGHSVLYEQTGRAIGLLTLLLDTGAGR